MSGESPPKPTTTRPPRGGKRVSCFGLWCLGMRFRGFSRFEAYLFTGGAGGRPVGFFGLFFSSKAFYTLLLPSQGLLTPPPRGVPRDMARTLRRSG
eukprot:4461543-Prymnesium_polylepis.1